MSKVGTHPAVAANGHGALHIGGERRQTFLNDILMLRHDQNRIGGLGHNVASLRDVAGHRAAGNENRIFDGRAAGKVDQFTVRDTERCFEGCRMLYFAADGDVFVGNRCVFFEGARHVERGLDVENGNADADRNLSGRHDAAGRFIDGNDFVTDG